MRCFIGIPVVRPLADQCRMLSQGMGLATPAANLHLTLAFLGEQSASDLNGLKGSLSALADKHASFAQLFDRCEPFPRDQGPFMALTGKASSPLQQLHAGLEECLEFHGLPLESRSFRPHITLARPGAAVTSFQTMGEWVLPVNALWLYRSEWAEPLPTYECLARFALKTAL